MMRTMKQAVSLLVLIAALGTSMAGAQSKGTIAPDQIPGVAVYIPYPVTIILDGKTDDWKNIPVQRVETGPTKGPDPKQNQHIDFAVAADNKNLYVYMHSVDTNIIAGKHKSDFWNEDSMEFYVNFSDNIAAHTYSDKIMQITINATNIGNKSPETLSLSGVNSNISKTKAKVVKTADGWAFEASVPFPAGFSLSHGKIIGFQVHANGASEKDRDSKLIWGTADSSDQSYQNPSLFGQAIFFKTGSTDIPAPKNLTNDMESTFKKGGAMGKNGKKIVWADEFNYEGQPDTKKWDYDAPDVGKYNQELQEYTSSRANSSVKDGMLTISAIKDAAGKWTSARIFTHGKADWTYGYMEIRAKVPAGKGTWPAIWMMPTNDTYGGWPNSGEIDIMETVGFEHNTLHTSLHTKSYNHKVGTQQTRAASVKNLSDDFHTYAVEWTTKGIFWYVDDQPFYSFLNENKGFEGWPFNKPFYLILNVAMGGSWGGMQGIDPNLKKADMIVDYVRVYQ